MSVLVLALVLQSSLLLPPRTAMENPAVVSEVPQKLRKDYDKLWLRFVSGKEDAKLMLDLEKLLRKQKTLDSLSIIQGYLSLYGGDDIAARERFTHALTLNPKNRIAMYYLAELAFVRGEYARAATLYAELQSIGGSQPELETKRQKAFLLATDNLLRSAARAESQNQLAQAEDYYRQALRLAPNEPTLHVRLADVLARQNKKDEADATRKAVQDLTPTRAKIERVANRNTDDLEDLGRWGNDIGAFHQIQNSAALTRAQLAVLLMRYFPQLTEFRQTSKIVIDIQDLPTRSEIQTVVGIGLMDTFPNHDFRPETLITRGEFAKALARLSRVLGLPPASTAPADASDVAPTNALYPDLQLVLGSGLLTLQDSGSFDVSAHVSGGQAVRSVARLLGSFQQLPR